MRKVLLVVISLALFSCSSETETKDSAKERVVNAIVDPGDPDMHIDCGEYSPYSEYNQQDKIGHKAYLLRNETAFTIKGRIYLMPKYSQHQFSDIVYDMMPEYFIWREFTIDPGYCKNIQAGDSSYNLYVYENTDAFWGAPYNNQGIIDDGAGYMPNLPNTSNSNWGVPPAFAIYPGTSFGGSTWIMYYYKVAFIEYIILDDNGNRTNPHYLSLENWGSESNYPLVSPLRDYFQDVNSVNGSMSLNWTIPGKPYSFSLASEVSPAGAPRTMYYTVDGVNQTSEDLTFGVRGVFRHMPFVVPPNNYPHSNPDTSPGYIIRFENL